LPKELPGLLRDFSEKGHQQENMLIIVVLTLAGFWWFLKSALAAL